MKSLQCKSPNCSGLAYFGHGRRLTYMAEIAFGLCEQCWMRNPINPSNDISNEAIDAINADPHFALTCTRCDATINQQHEALLSGWKNITYDDGPSWNFIGDCPVCHAKNAAEEEAFLNTAIQPGMLF